MKRMLGGFGLALALAVAGAGAASAQDVETQTFKDWIVRCTAGSTPLCQMHQRITQEAGEQLIEIVISYVPAEDRYPFVIELPLGIILPPGVTLRVNESIDFPNLPVNRCPNTGCLVEIQATPEMLAALRAGTDGRFLMLLPDGRTLAIVFSVNGFSAAMDAMVARNKAAP